MIYYILTIFVVLVTIYIGVEIRWRRKAKKYWADRGIPFEASPNIIAVLKALKSKPIHELLLEAHRKLGRTYGAFEFKTPVLTVCEPDILRDILVKDFHVFSSRREFDFGDDMVNKMVSILKGEDWKRVRTIITPAFTSKKMRQMSHIIVECTKTVIEIFRKHAEEREPVDCKGVFGAFTLDVIARSAFATKIDSLGDPENEFVKYAKQFFGSPSILRFMAIFLLPTRIVRFFKLGIFPGVGFFKNVVTQVVKERRKTGKKYNDILQLMLDAQDEVENESSKGSANTDGDDIDQYGSVTSNGIMPRLKYKKLYEDELVAQCILFFVVGYETTASTLSYLAYSLALNPECQEKLLREVDDIFKKHDEIDYDVIRDMKYLDCVVSETLRMYPSAVRGERTANEDYRLGNTDVIIEKGTIVGFNIHAMHYDPEFFPDPEKFDPERFMSENAHHPQYSYLPFGAGPRNCLGMRFALMEIKLCITNILRNYKFQKAETTKVPLEYKKLQGLLSVNDLPLAIERRNI